MKKEIRQKVYEKYNGLCAYTGKPLDNDWQIDHMNSKSDFEFQCRKETKNFDEYKKRLKTVDNLDNLMPAIKIVNHYKRDYSLETFRKYMMCFHERLAKLPKKTTLEKTKNRIKYMNTVAELFGITPEKPFCGKFYFEILEEKG